MKTFKNIATKSFDGVECNFYSNNGQMYMTGNQIGRALGYNNPDDAIGLIHNEHSDRMNKFSIPFRLKGSNGELYDTIAYSQQGIFEICRWSQQIKVNAFMDWVWDIMESYHNGTLEKTQKLQLPQNDFSALCLQVNEMENTLDKFYDRLSALERLCKSFG